MKKPEGLKACPFCGSVEHLELVHADELRDDECESYHGNAWTIVCNYIDGGCGAMSGFSVNKDDVIPRWNTRNEATK